jgi:hypothetical protein
MKKYIAITSALALFAVSSGLFAQEAAESEPAPALKFSGEYVTGVNIATPGSGDTTAKLWHDDGGASRLQLNLEYATDTGGVKGRIQQALNASSTYASDGWAYGWVNLFDKKAVISAGQIDDALWGNGGVIDTNLDAIQGVRFAVFPIDGLSFGFSLPLAYSAITLENTFKNIIFGTKYASKIFSVSVAAKLNADEDDNTGVDLIFGVNVVPSSAIAINLSGYFGTGDVIAKDTIGSYDSDGDSTTKNDSLNLPGFRIVPKVTFTQDALSVYAYLDVKLDTDDTAFKKIAVAEADGDPAIGFRVHGQYAVTPVIKPYVRVGSDNVAYFAGNGLYVRLGSEFVLGNGISLNVWDHIKGIAKDGDDQITNTVQVNFTWAF